MRRKFFTPFALAIAVGMAGSAPPSLAIEVAAVEFIGQLHPAGLPFGVTYGGSGGASERRIHVSGNLAVVGAGLFLQPGDEGRAFVFDISNPNALQQIAILRASDSASGNEFGNGVVVSGNYVFVGARGDSQQRGAVYMYDVSDPANIIERKITAFDAAPNNEFGFSLAVDGTRLIVGAPKFTFSTLPPAAYIVDFTDPDQLVQKKITPNPMINGGFAMSVDISGNYVIVGQNADSTDFPFAGSAHLYDISNLDAIVEKRLTPTDAPNYSDFGRRVSISGTKARSNRFPILGRATRRGRRKTRCGPSISATGTISCKVNMGDPRFAPASISTSRSGNISSCRETWQCQGHRMNSISSRAAFGCTTYRMC